MKHPIEIRFLPILSAESLWKPPVAIAILYAQNTSFSWSSPISSCRGRMPTLNLFTNVPVDTVVAADILKDASKAVSKILGKPESVKFSAPSPSSLSLLLLLGLYVYPVLHMPTWCSTKLLWESRSHFKLLSCDLPLFDWYCPEFHFSWW